MADSSKLSFVELMKQQPSYGPLMDKPVKYQLTALYNGTYWSLAIKGDQSDLCDCVGLTHSNIVNLVSDNSTIVMIIKPLSLLHLLLYYN